MVNHALVTVGDAEVGIGNIRHVIVVVIVLVVICVLFQEDLDRENVLSRMHVDRGIHQQNRKVSFIFPGGVDAVIKGFSIAIFFNLGAFVSRKCHLIIILCMVAIGTYFIRILDAEDLFKIYGCTVNPDPNRVYEISISYSYSLLNSLSGIIVFN